MKANRNLNDLHEKFRVKVELFLKDCKENWLHIFVTEWFRTRDRQYFLYGKWRSKETLRRLWVPEWYSKPNESQVTWTLNSNHQKWLAIDIAFDPEEHESLYPISYNLWRRVADIALKYGINWYHDLHSMDKPHFECNWLALSLDITTHSMFYKHIWENDFKSKTTELLGDVKWAIARIQGLPKADADSEIIYLLAIVLAKLEESKNGK